MLEMTGFDQLFSFAGWLYIALAVAAALFAAWFPGRWWTKAIAAVVVLTLFMTPPYALMMKARRVAEARAKVVAEARAVFQERCKSAGESTTRTVDNVEGIRLLKIRPRASVHESMTDPNWPDAAFASESQGEWYVRTFLGWEHGADENRGTINSQRSALPGYKYVEAPDENGQLFRYQFGGPGPDLELQKEAIQKPQTQYAVTFENLTDPSDRQHWVAGTVLKVVDLRTDEVIATQTIFAFEPGLGDLTGFRLPWSLAETCPAFRTWRAARTRFFVDRVLVPKKWE